MNPSPRTSIALLSAALLASHAIGQRPSEQRPAKRLRGILLEDPSAPERMARMNGKYSMLLRQIEVDEPGEEPLREAGYKTRRHYHGHRDLPPAYWVYARPYWFLFRDRADRAVPPRNWGPEQATGKPDAPGHGDREVAWASKQQDNSEGEWLLLEYPDGIKVTAVEIHETFNPGAVSRIAILQPDGEELEVWKAAAIEPQPPESRVLRIPMPLGFVVTRIAIYLETGKVPGWNEIDAVALVDDKGTRHWATAAEASSTYAPERTPGLLEPDAAARPPRGAGIPAARPLEAPELRQPLVPVRLATESDAAAARRVAELERRVADLSKQVAEHRVIIEALRRELEELRKRQH